MYIRSGVSPSLAELVASNWESVISRSGEKIIYQYAAAFRRRRDELDNAGDHASAAVFGFLFEVSSFGLDWASKERPFKPSWVLQNGTRTSMPADLTDSQVEVLAESLPNIEDAEMAAWVGDVLWMRKRDYKGAERAVTGYLDSAARLEDPEQWVLAAQRIQRALNIARALNNKTLIDKTVKHIESVLARYKGEDPFYFSAQLMELLLDAGQGDSGVYASLAEYAAAIAKAAGNLDRARKYLELQKQWLIRDNRSAEAETIRAEIAETYANEAEKCLNLAEPNYMLSEYNFNRAIHAYRQIGQKQDRIDELHKRLLETQRLAVAQLKTRRIATMDVSAMANDTIAAVSGKSFLDALLWLASRMRPFSVDRLRQDVQSRERGIADVVHQQILDRSGRVVAQAPWTNGDDPESVARMAQFEMRREAEVYRLVRAYATIEPARRQLLMEHPIGVGDWIEILSNSPFVPEHREQIFARGLQAGLTGDMLVAAHLLTPQLENSFRCVLAQHGAITSKLDEWGNQEDLNIDELLDKEEFRKIFSESLEFDLRALLVRKDGPNIRHGIAHGLIDETEFWSYDYLYLWGMVIYLCFAPLVGPPRMPSSDIIHGSAKN